MNEAVRLVFTHMRTKKATEGKCVYYDKIAVVKACLCKSIRVNDTARCTPKNCCF